MKCENPKKNLDEMLHARQRGMIETKNKIRGNVLIKMWKMPTGKKHKQNFMKRMGLDLAVSGLENVNEDCESIENTTRS